MAAKESEGLTDGGTAPPTSASLPAAQEASIAGQYSAMDIRGGKTGEEAEVSRLTSRFASLRDREERLAEIAGGLRLIKEKRGSRPPTYIELAAAVLLQDSVAAALEGRPT
uniref:Uncharacterized protein n=1 Tax=Triticum urartu TaxID=4572 RepID=A0A8R7PIX7_TRIUA